MDLHALDKGTGYDQYYEPGEKDHIRDTLRRKGKKVFVDQGKIDREMKALNAKQRRAMKLAQSFDKEDTTIKFV